MAEISRMNAVKTNKELRLDKERFEDFERGVKGGDKLTSDDLPQIEYRYFEQHDIRSCPRKHPNGWTVSFSISYPGDSYSSIPAGFDEVKPTIAEAHRHGFAIARAVISGEPRETLTDFTPVECDAIEWLRAHIEIKQLTLKEIEERKANPIAISTKYLNRLELSEKQLRTLLRIAVSTYVAFEPELFSTFHSIRALMAAAPEPSTDNNERVKEWMARLPPLVESLECLMRMAHDYQGYGWPYDDPFVTRPMHVLEDIRKHYPGTTIDVTVDSAQALDLVYPKQTLFRIFHELITNAIQHGRVPVHVRIAWRVQDEKFICEIEDNGPGLCENLSATYLDGWKLGICGWRGLPTVGHALITSHSFLRCRRSAELGGTQVKFELPLVGYWLEDQLHVWKNVYESTYIYPPLQEDAA